MAKTRPFKLALKPKLAREEAVQRQIIMSTMLEYEDLRQGGPYLMRSNDGMKYQHSVQGYNDGGHLPSVSTGAYSSPQPSHVMLDDWQRPYIYRGENEVGVWRQYVSLSFFLG